METLSRAEEGCLRRLKLYIAASLDGYIAGPNGEIDWLETGGGLDYGYSDFYASIDATLMGRATYEVTQTVEEFPYPDKTNYVFTRNPAVSGKANVRFVSGDIASFARGLKTEEGQDIWLVGGGRINAVMLNADLIDDIILTVFPLVLGCGIPLFAPGRAAVCVQDRRVRSIRDGPHSMALDEGAARGVVSRGSERRRLRRVAPLTAATPLPNPGW